MEETKTEEVEIGALRLRFVVFFCGAVLMGLEMAGVRLLEPHFGSTIYVWGSIIGIFLGALSLGYWVGGMIADRYPRIHVLGALILGSALLILLIPAIASPVCRYLQAAESLGPRARALLGSLILYALPSILLGMVSPFAVRLAAHSVRGLGSVAGGLYAFSTLGSLMGTFLVSFVLTELLGSKVIVFALATVLVLVALVCMIDRLRGAPGASVVLACLLMIPSWEAAQATDLRLQYEETPGSSDLTPRSVLDWQAFLKALGPEATHPVGKRLRSALKAGSPISLDAPPTYLEQGMTKAMTDHINAAFASAYCFLDSDLKGLDLPYHAKGLLKQGRADWNPTQARRFNRLVLKAAFPRLIESFPHTGRHIVEGGRYSGTYVADAELDYKESVYHSIGVVESRSIHPHDPDGRARLMTFNNQIESGVKITADGSDLIRPIRSACGYTRLLHLGLLLTEKAPRNMVIIGCGGGIGPQVFVQDYKESIERIDVVDIDPAVFTMARRHFGYPKEGESEIIHSYAQDGRLFVSQAKHMWDYVILDAYTTGGRIPRHLISKEFFKIVRDRLTADGVVVANVISSVEGDGSRLYRAVWKTLETTFPFVCAFPRGRHGVSGENIILVATPNKQQLSSTQLQDRLRKLKSTLLKRRNLETIVAGAVLPSSKPKMEDVPVLTDDFCPTDSMVFE